MANEVTNKDLYDLIQGLVTKTDAIQKQNAELKNQLTSEIRTIKSEVSEDLDKIRKENSDLRSQNRILKERLLGIEKKVKKYNLIFYGVDEKENKVVEIQAFLELLNLKLEIVCQFTDIRDIFRLGKVTHGKSRPLSVEFVTYSLKVEVLKQSKKLKGTGIFIAKDYTAEEYQERKTLYEHLIIAKDSNHQAVIKQNCLYVNGLKYTYDDLKEKNFNFTIDQQVNSRDEYDKEQETEKLDNQVTEGTVEDSDGPTQDNSILLAKHITKKPRHHSRGRTTRQVSKKKINLISQAHN